jgi:hypothetical protein
MKNFFEIEFYYRSSDAEQLRQLRVIEGALSAVSKNTYAFRKIDMDSEFVSLPEGIPGLPCLRRLSPAPERVILGPLKTEADVWIVMGISTPKAPLDSDRFTGWGRNK